MKKNEKGYSAVDGLVTIMIPLVVILPIMLLHSMYPQNNKATDVVSSYVLQEIKAQPTFTGFNDKSDGINLNKILGKEKVISTKCGDWEQVENTKKTLNFKSTSGCKIAASGNWKSFTINTTTYSLTVDGKYTKEVQETDGW